MSLSNYSPKNKTLTACNCGLGYGGYYSISPTNNINLRTFTGGTGISLSQSGPLVTINGFSGDFTDLADTGHTHPISQVTSLQTCLDSKLNDATNVGSGIGICQSISTGNLNLRSICGDGGVNVNLVGNTIVVSGSGSTSMGDITGGTNLGGGVGVFDSKSGSTLQFNTLSAITSNLNINQVGNVIQISASTASGGSGTVTSITAGAGLSGGTITTTGTIGLDTTIFGDFLEWTGSVINVTGLTSQSDFNSFTADTTADITYLSGQTDLKLFTSDFNAYTAATDADISYISGQTVVSGTSLGSGEAVFGGKSGSNLTFKSIVDGNNISTSSTASELTINAVPSGSTNEIQFNNSGSFAASSRLQYLPSVSGFSHGINNTLTGDNAAIIAGNYGYATGNNSVAMAYGYASGSGAVAAGAARAYGTNSFAFAGSGAAYCNESSVFGGSTNYACNIWSTVVGGGFNYACGYASGVFAGSGNTICSGAAAAVILGGSNITLTGSTYENTAAVERFAIMTALDSGVTGDTVLVRNTSTGVIRGVTQASLGAGGGQSNTASNVGGGVGVFDTKVGVDLQFNSLSAITSNLDISLSGNVIQFSASTGGGSVTAENGLSVESGNVVLGGTLTGDTIVDTNNTYGIGFGRNITSSGNNSFATGYYASASGNYSFATGGFGTNATNSGSVALACGKSYAANSVAMTRGTVNIAGGNSVAINCATTCAGYTFAAGRFSCAQGQEAFAAGNGAIACGNASTAINNSTIAIGNYSFVGGSGQNATSPSRRVIACGGASFNFSCTNDSQGNGFGANGDQAVILGGYNNNIGSSTTRVAIIAGSGITITSTAYDDHVIVPNLAINNTPQNGTGSDDVLVWDSGDTIVKKVTQASISDINLKENIAELSPVLPSISELKSYEFNFKTNLVNDYRKHYGLIAQEVEEVFPHVVKSNYKIDEQVYKTVEYRELVPILFKGINELQNKISVLEQEIDKLRK